MKSKERGGSLEEEQGEEEQGERAREVGNHESHTHTSCGERTGGGSAECTIPGMTAIFQIQLFKNTTSTIIGLNNQFITL